MTGLPLRKRTGVPLPRTEPLACVQAVGVSAVFWTAAREAVYRDAPRGCDPEDRASQARPEGARLPRSKGPDDARIGD